MKSKSRLKPSQRTAARGGSGGESYGKAIANKRSFSLVFLLNTIDEEKVKETLSHNSKMKNSLISKAAKKGFIKGFTSLSEKETEREEPQQDVKLVDSSSSEEEEENELIDETEPISSSEEVYLDNIRNNLSLMEHLRDISNDIIKHLDNVEEPKDIDHLLSIVSYIFDFTYEKEKMTEPNKYYSRFNVNFEFLSDFSYLKFEALLTILYKLLSCAKFSKYSVEVPFDVIHRQKINLDADPLVDDKFYILNVYFGSQINLSKFYCHFKLPISSSMAQVPMVMQLHFQKKYMIIYFMLDTNTRIHKIYYSFSSFRAIILEWHSTFTRVYIDCICAPTMNYADLNSYQQNDFIQHQTDICNISGLERKWMRTVKFMYSTSPNNGRQRNNYRNGHRQQQAQQNNSKPQDEHLLGMARTLCFDMPNEDPALPRLVRMAYFCRERIKSFQFFLTTIKQVHRWPKLFYSKLMEDLTPYQLPFQIHFALLVLFSDSYKVIDAFAGERSMRLFLDTIGDFIDGNKFAQLTVKLSRLEQAIYLLKTQCRECIIIHPCTEFLKILKNIDSIVIEEERADYVTIRRATLYPSHLELVQPVSLLRSRFSDLADLEYGLRMTFADDNGGVLNKYKDCREKDFILGVMKPKLKDGVVLGDRTYLMLGSSTSQMRDSGCTLYACDKRGRTAEDVRRSAGQLSTFKSPSKYIARFGLVFSQSMTIIPLESDVNICYLNDILGVVKPDTKDYTNSTGERYILSDGIGMVDRRIAERWQPYLQVKNDYFPSAYQIRLGGCKGMLTVYPPESGPLRLIIRDSMKKYESDSRSIGILKYSMPRPVYLNRPLINILDHMEVDKDELYSYCYKSTASVVKATLYDSCAMDLIHTYSSGLLPYEKVLNAGVSLLDEPFLRSIINYLIYYRLNFELKLKARIRVPNDGGRIAFGVLDEEQVLEYGQIFFQYTKLHPDGRMAEGGETVVLEGEVMVTKFPCLQPGDVRKFTAVNHPRLRHIKDCLVFPANGHRSHCDEMSGSDLDGDEYAVIFDQKLYFPGQNRPAMDFPYGLNSNKQGDITLSDMVEFFLHYLMLNNIGVVANTHLMYSDFLPDGLDNLDCESLAYLYNISLDFPKTGVIMPMPRRGCTLAIRPDFMERNNFDQVYLSKKMLGEYFRHCSLVERAIELSQYDYRFTTFSPTMGSKRWGSLPTEVETFQMKHGKSFIKNKLILPEWRRFYKQANDALTEYRTKVINLMEQLEVENEVMLFADVYEEKKDVTKVLLDRLFAHFQRKFTKQCEALGCTTTIDRLYLVSAWYAICHEKNYTYNGKPLLGMPWLVADEVCQLAQYSFSGKVATEAALAQTVRRMVTSEGETLEMAMDINHKQLVPYSLEAALIFDMLFDYRTIVVYDTEVVHHYWAPFKALRRLHHSQHAHLLPVLYEHLEEMQYRLVMQMVMKFFNVFRLRVYQHDGDVHKVIRFPQEVDEKTGQVNVMREEQKLFEIISKRLTEIIASCGRNVTEGIESLPTISTIFNRVLYYLFDILNRVNSAIHHANMEELFLIKYAVFALSFLNKIDTKLDRQFYMGFSKSFERDWLLNINRYNALYQSQLSSAKSLKSNLPDSLISNFESSLDVLFNSYLLDNNFLTTETISFYLPPMDSRINLLEETDELISKLIHLSGVTSIEFKLTSGKTWGKTTEEQNLMDEDDDPASGLPTAKPGQSAGDPFEQLRQHTQNFVLVEGSQKCSAADEQGTEQSACGGPHQSQIGKLSRKADVLKTIPYEVTTTGLMHSTKILRLLIGHPSFFKIYPLFEVLSIDD